MIKYGVTWSPVPRRISKFISRIRQKDDLCEKLYQLTPGQLYAQYIVGTNVELLHIGYFSPEEYGQNFYEEPFRQEFFLSTKPSEDSAFFMFNPRYRFKVDLSERNRFAEYKLVKVDKKELREVIREAKKAGLFKYC